MSVPFDLPLLPQQSAPAPGLDLVTLPPVLVHWPFGWGAYSNQWTLHRRKGEWQDVSDLRAGLLLAKLGLNDDHAQQLVPDVSPRYWELPEGWETAWSNILSKLPTA